MVPSPELRTDWHLQGLRGSGAKMTGKSRLGEREAGTLVLNNAGAPVRMPEFKSWLLHLSLA